MQRRITFITYLGQTIVNFVNCPSLCVRQPLANDTWHVNSEKKKKPFGKNKQPFSVQEFIPIHTTENLLSTQGDGAQDCDFSKKIGDVPGIFTEKFLRAKHGFLHEKTTGLTWLRIETVQKSQYGS